MTQMPNTTQNKQPQPDTKLPGIYTAIDHVRMDVIKREAKHVRGYSIPGGVVEIGVYFGGSLNHISLIFDDRPVFGVDTFEGMPKTREDIDTGHKEGDFSEPDYETVKQWFQTNRPNVALIKGMFPYCADRLPYQNYCFVHVDVDIYQSTFDCFAFFFPRLSSGGVIICDDYGFPQCRGAKQAVDEYLTDKDGWTGGEIDTHQFVLRKT